MEKYVNNVFKKVEGNKIILQIDGKDVVIDSTFPYLQGKKQDRILVTNS